jgi:murein DD-endopeptidase MepM/ murein hydrolase activator NlpD
MVSSQASSNASIVAPLKNFATRVTKKPFGIQITKADSPVQPERFAGYHTGTDFEMLPGEEEAMLPVQAICTGPVLVARQADGYGGVMVQSCVIDGEAVTVLYGHLAFTLSSIQIIPGTHLEAGQTFATLGTAFSDETDGERQHLHLGIHKGTAAVLAGYVQTEKELDAWIDPMTILAR